jgi:Ca2+-binding RTX toxin-like protein
MAIGTLNRDFQRRPNGEFKMCELCGFARIADYSSVTHEASVVADAGLVIGYTAPNPLPVFTTAQIVQALRTSWLGAADGNNDFPMDTTTRWMYSQSTFNSEITYKFDQNNTVTYASGATTVRGSMSAIEQGRISEAMEIWDDFIRADIRQDNAASTTVFFTTGGSGNISPNSPGDTSGRAFARTDTFERNVNNIYGTEDYGISSAEINLGRGFAGGELDGINSSGVADGGAFDLSDGQRGFTTLLHEIGHTLGLSHPGFYNGTAPASATGVRFAQDSLQNTIMSYFNEGAGANFRGISPSTPMVYDILTAQIIYQADTTTRNTATVYGFDNTSGRGAYSFSTTQGSVFTIWDSGGIDTLNASGFTSGVRIDLTPGSYSDIGYSGGNTGMQMIGNIGIAFNCIIENVFGTSALDTITGNVADNLLIGGAGGDKINGGSGNDTLYAGTAAVLPVSKEFDYLFGGDGSDKLYGTKDTEFYGEAGGDEVFLLGQMTSEEINDMFSRGWLDGGTSANSFGTDIDTLWLNQITRSFADILTKTGFTLNILDGKFESAHGSAGNDVLGGKTLPPFVIELSPSSYSLYGEGGNDQLNGNGAINYFEGGTGNDILQGYGGDDRLFGGTGNDEIFGGAGTDSIGGEAGDDKLHIDYADTLSSINQLTIFFNGGDGHDIAYMEGSQGFVLDMGLREFEEAYGSEGDDYLDAFNVNEAVTLDGRGGADAMRGSIYNDFMTDTGADLGDVFDGDIGTDTVSYDWYQGGVYIAFDHFDTNYGRVTGVDSDIGIDTLQNIENIIGGNGSDQIYGSSANIANLFKGEAGTDFIYGGGGADRIYGGLGTDYLYGDAGEDSLFGGLGNDTLDGGAESDILNYETETTAIKVIMTAAGGGTAVGSGIGSDTFTSLETIISGSGGDTFYTAAGSETIGTGVGNDIIYASAGWDLYSGGDGEDVVSYGGFTQGLTFTFSTDVILADSLNGDRDYLYEIENITGGAGADTIEGNNVANKLIGNAGADKFKGGLGNDILDGGYGNDTFIYTGGNTGLDQVNGGADSDTLDFSGLANLAWVDLAYAGSEAWTLIGTVWVALANTVSVENATGSAGADRLWGDAQANSLSGGAGTDRIEGRGGNDLLSGGNNFDTFVYSGSNNGVDQVDGGNDYDTLDFSGQSTLAWVDLAYTGASGIEAWTQVGATWVQVANVTAVENVTGTAFADQLWGNLQNNTLIGGLGNDRLDGRTGFDTVTGGGGSDSFLFAPGASGQSVTTFDSITDFTKGAVGVGDRIDYSALLSIGGSAAAASATQASINAATGVATFAAGSGTTQFDAILDIATRMTASVDKAGEFAFFRINGAGSEMLFISDGIAGVTANDVVVNLNGITSVNSISLSGGDITILT